MSNITLGIGTAQFGLDYGISNTSGQTPQTEVASILALAQQNNALLLDTAPAYGESEKVLGKVLKNFSCGAFKIISKTPALSDITLDTINNVQHTLKTSLQQLNQPSLYALLVHHPQNLMQPDSEMLYAYLQHIKAEGHVQKIGVSIYTAKQLDIIFKKFPLDLVQLPLNVLDQRLITSGHLQSLHQQGVEIHVRSVFLQGLLLMPLETLPSYFFPIQNHLNTYHQAVQRAGLSLAEAALGFVKGISELNTVIVGVNTHQQFKETLQAFKNSQPNRIDYNAFALNDPAFVDPTHWAK